MKKIKLPLSLRMIRGAVGKRFVIKHYAYGIVQTKFPDMIRIIPSDQQRACRNLFKIAVAAAKRIFDDPAQRHLWAQKLRCKRRLFNRIVQYFMGMEKSKQSVAAVQTRRLIINCFKHTGLSALVADHHSDKQRRSSFDSNTAPNGLGSDGHYTPEISGNLALLT